MRGVKKTTSVAIAIICCIILFPSLAEVHPNSPRNVKALDIPPAEKFTMLFASDVHMGFPYVDDVSSKDTAKLIADINYSIHPDSLVLVGDLTDAALDYQWDALQQVLGNISDPVLRENRTFLAIGNHDVNGSIGITANHDRFKQRFGYLPNYTFEIGNILFIVLATECFQVYGFLTQSQINWLNSTITANIDKNIVIVSHHPLQNTTYSTSLQVGCYENGVDQQLHSMMRWHSANVSMWIHGHRHGALYQQNQSNIVDGITYFNVAGVEYQSFPYLEISWLAEFTQGSKNVSFKPRVSNAGIPYWIDNMTRNVSLKYSFELDLPTGSIVINSGAAYTNRISVTLALTASANVSQMLLSNDRVKWTSRESFAASRAWTLSAGDGSKTICVRFFDIHGDPSLVYNDLIILDTISPTLTITEADNTIFQSTSVTINWNTFDMTSGLDSIEVSLDSSESFTTLTNTSTSMSWDDLANGDHYAIVRAIDKAGNEIDKRIDFKVEIGSGGSTSGLPNWLFPTIIVVAIAAIMVFLVLRRMKRDKSRPQQPPQQQPVNHNRFR